MSTKKIVSGTVYYGIIPKLTIIVNVLILPIITPYLSTDDYGIQGIITSYSSVFLAIAPLGLHVHLVNSYYEYKNKYNLVWGRILCLQLILGVLFGTVNMLVLFFALPKLPLFKIVLLSFVGSIQIFLMSNSILAQHLFPIIERPKPLVLTNLFASLFGIGTSFVLIYYAKLGYWGLVSSVAVSSLVSFLVFFKYVWVDYDIWPIFEHNLRRLRQLFRISLPLVPHALGFALLTSSARIVMNLYHVSYDEIGLFSHGCIMGDYAVIITSALSTALVASIQNFYRNHNYERFRQLYFLCQWVAVLSSMLICLWMSEIYKILIHNDSLAESSHIASLICFANIVLPLYTFMSTITLIEKKTMQILWLVFIPGFINLLLCLIFIPIYGFKAAIYSTICAYWSQILIPFGVKYYKESVSLWLGSQQRLIGLLILFICTLLFSNFASGFNISIKIMISLVSISVFVYWYYKNSIYTIV